MDNNGLIKTCIGCKRYDFNDYLHGFGTCERQDEEYPAEHDCNIPNDFIVRVESDTYVRNAE